MAGRSSARPERIIVLSELAVSTVALRLLWNPKHWGLAPAAGRRDGLRQAGERRVAPDRSTGSASDRRRARGHLTALEVHAATVSRLGR